MRDEVEATRKVGEVGKTLAELKEPIRENIYRKEGVIFVKTSSINSVLKFSFLRELLEPVTRFLVCLVLNSKTPQKYLFSCTWTPEYLSVVTGSTFLFLRHPEKFFSCRSLSPVTDLLAKVSRVGRERQKKKRCEERSCFRPFNSLNDFLSENNEKGFRRKYLPQNGPRSVQPFSSALTHSGYLQRIDKIKKILV